MNSMSGKWIPSSINSKIAKFLLAGLLTEMVHFQLISLYLDLN